ncbi:hypothetical protein HZS_767 [Henneguya salminicola]|nr:hypothetical protein HZS_767 [Henneguya salminicola]
MVEINDNTCVNIIIEEVKGIKTRIKKKVRSFSISEHRYISITIYIIILSNGKVLYESKKVKGKNKFVFDESLSLKASDLTNLLFHIFQDPDTLIGEAEITSIAELNNTSLTIEISPVGYFSFQIHFIANPTPKSDNNDQSTMENGRKSTQNHTIHIMCRHEFIACHLNYPCLCPICKKFIWGLFNKQAYKCIKCHFLIHKKCLYKVCEKCSASENNNQEEQALTTHHNFLQHSPTSLTFCDHCGKVLMGIKQCSLQCEDCKMNIHLKCQPNATTTCGIFKEISIPIENIKANQIQEDSNKNTDLPPDDTDVSKKNPVKEMMNEIQRRNISKDAYKRNTFHE